MDNILHYFLIHMISINVKAILVPVKYPRSVIHNMTLEFLRLQMAEYIPKFIYQFRLTTSSSWTDTTLNSWLERRATTSQWHCNGPKGQHLHWRQLKSPWGNRYQNKAAIYIDYRVSVESVLRSISHSEIFTFLWLNF